MDTYSGGWSILFIAIFECISIGWVYGKDFYFRLTYLRNYISQKKFPKYTIFDYFEMNEINVIHNELT